MQHTGRMQSGHYTAFVKDTAVPAKGKGGEEVRWFHVSDERYVAVHLIIVLSIWRRDVVFAYGKAKYLLSFVGTPLQPLCARNTEILPLHAPTVLPVISLSVHLFTH